MRLVKTFRSAGRALRRNVMRSVLTTLGIIIGIAAVIAMMEVGKGATGQMEKSLSALGANNLMVFPGSRFGGGVQLGSGSRVTLTAQDADAIRERCPAIREVAPIVQANGQLVAGGNNWRCENVIGSSPEYLDVRGWPVVDGETFTHRDVSARSPVCLVGLTLVRELFGGQSPLGKEVRIQGVNLRVIGVLGQKGANMFGR